MSTKACSHGLDFYYNNFLYASFFWIQKHALYVNFIISLHTKWLFSQGLIHLVDMGFCRHVSNSPRNKNLKSLDSYLIQKMVFTLSKRFALGTRKKALSSTLNFMILQIVRNEWIMFGIHVNYKILQLIVPKRRTQFCTLHLAFKRGYFEKVLDSTWPLIFGG
jgi:hypothetical protein